MGAAPTVCTAGGGRTARGLTLYLLLDLVSFYDTFILTSTTWKEEETQKCKRTYMPV